MRQVSTTSLPQLPHYGIIGNGLIAKHIKCYLMLSNCEYSGWHRKSNSSIDNVFNKADIVIIAISDDAIEPFLEKHQQNLMHKPCIHFSGSLYTEYAYGFHPLMTFTHQLYTLEQYQRILFVKDDNAPAIRKFFPSFTNPTITIQPEKKPYYHALCVMANNFTTLLWQMFFSAMQESFHADSKDLLPLLEQTFINISNDHINALTGPLARNDQITITRHLQTLATTNPKLLSVYQSFVELYDSLNSSATCKVSL